jgi:hypothetical protein
MNIINQLLNYGMGNTSSVLSVDVLIVNLVSTVELTYEDDALV